MNWGNEVGRVSVSQGSVFGKSMSRKVRSVSRGSMDDIFGSEYCNSGK